ncbi:MAG: preprotein translocase subunit SecG [Victivallaceae bacterium]
MLFLYYAFLFFLLLVSVSVCFLVLIQESKSMGLGASFGVDSGDSVFGVSTPVVLKRITAWLSVIFVLGCVILSVWTSALGKKLPDHELGSIENPVGNPDD